MAKFTVVAVTTVAGEEERIHRIVEAENADEALRAEWFQIGLDGYFIGATFNSVELFPRSQIIKLEARKV